MKDAIQRAFLMSDLQEGARRLQAQSGHLMHQLMQPTVDLAAVVRTLGSIEDTARKTIETFHNHAKDSTA